MRPRCVSDEHPLGTRGRQIDRRAPFYLGLVASAGVAVTYGAVRVLGSMSSVLALIGVAMFFALGFEPVVSWLINRKFPRWAAVALVVGVAFILLGGTVAATIPPLSQQARELIVQAPHYLQQAQDHSSVIGRLNERFHLQQRITESLNGSGGPAFAGLVKAGSAVVGTLTDLGVVAVLTVYFLVDMPRIRTTLYRFVARLPTAAGDPPRGRDPRQGRCLCPRQPDDLGHRRCGHLCLVQPPRCPIPVVAGRLRRHLGPSFRTVPPLPGSSSPLSR